MVTRLCCTPSALGRVPQAGVCNKGRLLPQSHQKVKGQNRRIHTSSINLKMVTELSSYPLSSIPRLLVTDLRIGKPWVCFPACLLKTSGVIARRCL